ncbi:hypothetical protein IV203_030575 [Nitzschia inconspicua]|uniref:Uncharacterized protein n=1 Tax=Nitzschia inconspicua TaxID=303405 RepID=A0A9K3LTC1_9STRA|nr:hypothetical protein IV203_022909 [Nitzschia inconspicua]KAG7367832.1 hypothetical protein IV203_030575 [Nitzschia inconspicua]
MNHNFHLFLAVAVLLFLLWWMRPVDAAVDTTSTYNTTELFHELMLAMNNWNKQMVTHYEITTQRDCLCQAKYLQPLKIEVNQTEIVNVRDVSDGLISDLDVLRFSVFTVDELFDVIQHAIHQNFPGFRVGYHPEYGYPTSIYFIDDSTNQVDDGNFILDVSNFLPLSQWQMELDHALDLWNDHDMSHYGYSFQRRCEDCPPEYTQPMRIIVEEGQLKEATYLETLDPVPQSVVDQGGSPTIVQIFDLVQEAIDSRATGMIANYNNVMGYPVFFFVDHDIVRTAGEDEVAMLCGTMMPYSILKQNLNDHKERWDTLGIMSYTFTLQQQCTGTLCETHSLLELTQRYTVQVIDDQVMAVDGMMLDLQGNSSSQLQRSSPGQGSDIGFATDPFPTISELFEKLEQAIDDEPYKMDVLYNETFGYPTRIFIDQMEGTQSDVSLVANIKLLGVEEIAVSSGTTKKQADLASLELFPTIVAFILLTYYTLL